MTDTADKECKVGKIFRTVSMAMGQFPGSKHFQVSGFSLQIQPCFRKDGYSYYFSRLQKDWFKVRATLYPGIDANLF